MAKYVFTQDANFRPAGSSHLGVTFKKGDVVEGTMVRNNKTSEPPNFIEVQSAQGKIQVGYGGRGGSVLSPYTETSSTGNSSNSGSQQKTGDAKSFFTPKNVIIGILAIGVIIGGLKLAKVF